MKNRQQQPAAARDVRDVKSRGNCFAFIPLKIYWKKRAWLIYVAILFLYYVPFFIKSQQWLLLLLTTTALIVAVWKLQRTQCNRCYNLSCPVNRVPDDVKKQFFKHYPVFHDAWKKKQD